MFAALSTVEPPIVDREIVTYAERDKSWRDERMAMVEDRIRVRLGELSAVGAVFLVASHRVAAQEDLHTARQS